MQNLKTAFAAWENRIAPVFDTARQIYVVEVDCGRIVQERIESLAGDLPVQRALRLVELGIGTLICGAISRPLQDMITGCGIQVIPFRTGPLQEVMQAWFSDEFDGTAYLMPGCFGGRRRFGLMHGMRREGCLVKGFGQNASGMRWGQRRGRGGRRSGR